MGSWESTKEQLDSQGAPLTAPQKPWGIGNFGGVISMIAGSFRMR
jgi:hypothetical protein